MLATNGKYRNVIINTKRMCSVQKKLKKILDTKIAINKEATTIKKKLIWVSIIVHFSTLLIRDN